MTLWEFIGDRWSRLAVEAYQHASVVIQCTLVAAVIGVLVGVAVYRSPIGSIVATVLASAILTIPSFALLGLLIPLLGLGVAPTVTALVLYALLPIVRNTITGLRSVDPAVTESAVGMGLSRGQRLARIELPLAWPVVVTGIRVSTQLTVGIAAIAAIVNGPGLGGPIFQGLRATGTQRGFNLAFSGTVSVALLALLFDLLFQVIARLTTSKGLR